MALPLIIFSFLCLVALFFLVVGWLNIGSENGVAFIPFSGLGFLLTGAMLWTSGLETNNVVSTNTASEIITYTYQVLTVSDGGPLWLLANALFFGGFLIILVGFGRIMQMRTERKESMEEIY